MGRPAQHDGAVTRDIVRWALLGTIVCVLLVVLDVEQSGRNPLNLIQPGAAGPSVEVILEDFPGAHLPEGVGLDGQQFYVMARDPLHPAEHAEHLDRARYRWQRPLLAWTGWLLHPSGGGEGLIWALALAGTIGIAVGGLATGHLARALGGSPWLAAVFGVLPGAYYSLRVTVADALGLALALAALAAHAHGRRRLALGAAIGAVLAKEVTILVMAGWWLARRDRSRLLLVVAPSAVAVAWFVVLRLWIPGSEEGVGELAPPFAGWWSAVTDRWIHGDELRGMVASVAAAAAGAAALVRRGWRHPLGPAVAVHLAFTLVCNGNVLGQDFGGTRSTMALLLLGVLVLATPGAPQPERTLTEPSQGAAGMVGPGSPVGGSSNR